MIIGYASAISRLSKKHVVARNRSPSFVRRSLLVVVGLLCIYAFMRSALFALPPVANFPKNELPSLRRDSVGTKNEPSSVRRETVVNVTNVETDPYSPWNAVRPAISYTPKYSFTLITQTR